MSEISDEIDPEIEALSERDKSNLILTYVKKNSADLQVLKDRSTRNEERIAKLEKNSTNLEAQVEALSQQVKFLLHQNKIANLIVFKFPDTKNNNKDLRVSVLDLLQKINAEIKDSDIQSISRLGKTRGKRPILVRFTSQKLKSSLFKNLDKVKELGISISDDLSPEERQQRSKLLAFFPRLKKIGLNPKIRGEKILLDDGNLFSAEEIKVRLAFTTDVDATTPSREPERETKSTTQTEEVPPVPPQIESQDHQAIQTEGAGTGSSPLPKGLLSATPRSSRKRYLTDGDGLSNKRKILKEDGSEEMLIDTQQESECDSQ